MLMRARRPQALAAPASGILLACWIGVGMAAAAEEVTLTGKDHERTVPLEAGCVLVLELDATPGTGYSWTVVKNDPAVLKPLGPPRSVPKGDGGAPLGAAVKEVFRFSAEKKGGSTLELEYRRPWDRSSPPLETFRIEAQVR
jgi:predicted secreted protein